MKTFPTVLAMAVASITVGCSTIERSRNLADPNVTGRVLAEQVCSNCHGPDGNSVSPKFPRLAGQQAPYLAKQLKEFRSHDRADPAAIQYMWGLCRDLTDRQIDQLAEFYSTRPPSSNRLADPQHFASGKDIFEKGIAGDKGIPACQTCHGPAAQGKDIFPRLANQHADYILKQLNIFQKKTGRLNTPMDQVVSNLDDEQKEAIAAYIQGVEQSIPAATD